MKMSIPLALAQLSMGLSHAAECAYATHFPDGRYLSALANICAFWQMQLWHFLSEKPLSDDFPIYEFSPLVPDTEATKKTGDVLVAALKRFQDDDDPASRLRLIYEILSDVMRSYSNDTPQHTLVCTRCGRGYDDLPEKECVVCNAPTAHIVAWGEL